MDRRLVCALAALRGATYRHIAEPSTMIYERYNDVGFGLGRPLSGRCCHCGCGLTSAGTTGRWMRYVLDEMP